MEFVEAFAPIFAPFWALCLVLGSAAHTVEARDLMRIATTPKGPLAEMARVRRTWARLEMAAAVLCAAWAVQTWPNLVAALA